jgi:CubicO group peptidase (beta-lactamase class C family)
MIWIVLDRIVYYCAAHILRPLGMTRSTFRLAEVDPAQLVAAHARAANGDPIISPVFPYSRRHAPSSCLLSSVADMSRWIVAHLNHGRLGQARILKAASQKRLWAPLARVDATTQYGWGWWLFEHEGNPAAAMYGAQPGVQTALPVVLPGRSLAVLALGNCLGSYAEPLYAIDYSLWALSQLLAGKCCHPVTPVGRASLARRAGASTIDY